MNKNLLLTVSIKLFDSLGKVSSRFQDDIVKADTMRLVTLLTKLPPEASLLLAFT